MALGLHFSGRYLMTAASLRLSSSSNLAVLLFAATTLYMFWLVLADPFLGYANSYDFVRQSACVGVWSFIEGVDKTVGNYEFPSRWLIYDGDLRPAVCMHSIDNLFPRLAALAHQPGDLFSFAWIAAGKLLFLALGSTLLLWAAGALRLPIALLFALLFTDWAYLAYANTLYLEFSVIVPCFWLLAGGACLLAEPSRPRWQLLAVLVLALLWLGSSKQQYAPLAVVLGTAYALLYWLRWRASGASMLLFGSGLLAAVAFTLVNASSSVMMSTIDQANKTNTYLAAVLPAATDKLKALEQLGLPSTCHVDIGTNWYKAEGEKPCPEVVQVSRSQLPGLFITQPSTFLLPMYQALLQVRPFNPDYLGIVEPSAGDAGVRKLETVRPLSLTQALATLPLAAYFALLAMLTTSAVMVCIALLMGRRRLQSLSALQRGAMTMQVTGASVAFYALFSSVFGDGYIEIIKHAVAFPLGLTFQLVSLPSAWHGAIQLLKARESTER